MKRCYHYYQPHINVLNVISVVPSCMFFLNVLNTFCLNKSLSSHLVCLNNHMSRIVRNQIFAYAKTKAQISFAVTAKLISAFVLATWIEQFLFFLNPKFQASSLFL